MNALLVSHPHYPLLRTITLASLVKGRWIDGKAQTLLCCFLLAICPPFLYCKLFCRQDGGIASRYTECFYSHNLLKSTTAFRPHQPSQNRTIPRKSPTPLPPLSKGGGLTARHKLLLCCFLIAICSPFLYCKLFCRQDGGIVPPSLSVT